jgi:hypothetical protein
MANAQHSWPIVPQKRVAPIVPDKASKKQGLVQPSREKL